VKLFVHPGRNTNGESTFSLAPPFELPMLAGESPMSDVLTADPMASVTVFLGPQGGAEISFEPKSDLPYRTPYQFRVEHSRTPASGDWSEIATTTSTWTVVDVSRYNWDILAESWYRVVLIDSDGYQYASRAVHQGNMWDRRDFVLAREMCRRAYQGVRLGLACINGWLFRKITYGMWCQSCGNEITEQGTNSQCPECFGTGFSGGYHHAHPLPVLAPSQQLAEREGELTGVDSVVGTSVKAIAFPLLKPRDIWVAKSSGVRYAIQSQINTTVQVRGVPIILSFMMEKLPTTDITYELRTPDE